MTQTKPTVLLVDDDQAMLRMLHMILKRSGYEVSQCGGGAEALDRVEQDCPEVLITDWEMPGMDGLELCRRVRQANLSQYVYVVLLTAKDDARSMIAGMEAGADDFLTKPVSREALLARLRAGERVLELEKRLRELATTDSLTGIPTRRSFIEQFERETARSRRYHLPTSCVLVDIDFFKRINDTYGHPAGDEIIKVVADTMIGSSRDSDCVCRYGGEEFCAMLPETNEANAVIWADRLRNKLKRLEFKFGNDTLTISASMGVAQLQEGKLDLETAIDRADQALLVAKQTGRDRVVPFSSLDDSRNVGDESLLTTADVLEGMTAADVMVSPVVSLGEDESLTEAAEFFCRFRVNSAPVVNAQGQLCGILSEKDVLAVMLEPDAWDKQVRDVMRGNVVHYDETTPVRKIYDFLCRVTIRRVVVSRQGKPIGVISRGNLLRWCYQRICQQRLTAEATATDHAAPTLIESRHHRLHDAAGQLATAAESLCAQLDAADADPMPAVIESVRQIEHWLDQLIGAARADEAPDVTAAPIIG